MHSVLLCLASFDREERCRLASVAAYQELAGRMRDNRDEDYVVLDLDAAHVKTLASAFDFGVSLTLRNPYRLVIVNHLVTVCLRHWHPKVRINAAQSLFRVSANFYEIVYQKSEPLLNELFDIEKLDICDVSLVHGGVMLLGALLCCSHENEDLFLKSKNLLRIIAQSFDAMCLSACHVLYSASNLILRLLKFFKAKIHHSCIFLHHKIPPIKSIECKSDDTQSEACKAAKAYLVQTAHCSDFFENHSVRTKSVSPSDDHVRAGYFLLFNSYPVTFLRSNSRVIETLVSLVGEKFTYKKNINSRAVGIKCVSQILCESMQADNTQLFEYAFDFFIDMMNDRTRILNGDVGRIIRETAFNELLSFLNMWLTINPHYKFIPNQVQRMFKTALVGGLCIIDHTAMVHIRGLFSLFELDATYGSILQSIEMIAKMRDEYLKNRNQDELCFYYKIMDICIVEYGPLNWLIPHLCNLQSSQSKITRIGYGNLFDLICKDFHIIDCLLEFSLRHQYNMKVIGKIFDSIFSYMLLLKDKGSLLLKYLITVRVFMSYEVLKQFVDEVGGHKMKRMIDFICETALQLKNSSVLHCTAFIVIRSIQFNTSCDLAIGEKLKQLLSSELPRVRQEAAIILYESVLIYGDADHPKYAELLDMIAESDWTQDVSDVVDITVKLFNEMMHDYITVVKN
ncbi:hypothetical protein ACOME3_009864 [Neoechinorhynchus agilis]